MDNNILETIKNGEVRMKPRWHFILKTALMTVGGLILFFLIVYLVSFIIVIGRQAEGTLLIALPWLLILLALICVAALELLICRCPLAYRRPVLFSMIVVIILAGAGSYAVVGVRFHERFARYAEREQLPIAPRFYRIYLTHDIR